MKLTIIKEDNLVQINGVIQYFDLSTLVDANIWAVQWNETAGHIEKIDGENIDINSLAEFQNVINEYNNRNASVDQAEQVDYDKVIVQYLSGRIEENTVTEAHAAGITFTALTLEDKQAKRLSEIEVDRNNAIDAPVTSSALGSAHTYQAKSANRQFLNDLITLGNGGKFTCVDVNGVKARREHTHEQLLTLAADIQAAVTQCFEQYETLAQTIMSANDATDFNAIQWS